ncbi:MAG: hypothetical protein JSV91_08890 [Phycisphaerales bacterium]|nr:MAG: hypothetical protein JSV91_08890 [Phycisphaerales bacterium]
MRRKTGSVRRILSGLFRRERSRASVEKPRDLVRGEADMTDCDQVRLFLWRCRRALATGSPDLSLDLTEVRAADSKLVACLILVHKDAYDGRTSVNVTASDTVQDLVEIYKLDRLLEAKRP